MCGCMKKNMTAMTSAQAQQVVSQAEQITIQAAAKTETDQNYDPMKFASASGDGS